MKNKLFISIFSLLILTLIGGLVYFLGFRTLTINCGIVLEKTYSTNSVKLKLSYNEDTKWIKVPLNKLDKDAMAYNVILKGISIKSITPCKIYTGKVFSKSTDTIDLIDKTLRLTEKVFYYKLSNTSFTLLSQNSVLIGYDTYKFVLNLQNKIGAVIVKMPDIKRIRVGISNANLTSLNHETLMLTSKRSFKATTEKKEYIIKKDEALKITFNNGYMTLSKYSYIATSNSPFTYKEQLENTKKRFYVETLSDRPIAINSLKRENRYIPKYYDTLEFFIKDKKIRIINDVSLEQYLRFVVPSEMLSSGGIEGFKTQTVAARTYAISEMISGRFAKSGFHVDDTILSQAYNHQPSNPLSDKAVEETKGEVMTYNDKIIDAKYYSTSCGVGAPFNEVWYDKLKDIKTNNEPYLKFKNFTTMDIKNLSDEEKCADFLRDWTIKSFDSNSPYFRWKYSLSGDAIKKVINENIYTKYTKNPIAFKKLWYFNIYKNTTIPKNGIGKIKDFYISKRGQGGNVLELTIETDTDTYKIEKESNIKYILTPHNVNYEITKLYGNTIKNATNLPSAFFIIDKQLENSKIKNVTIYGGGFGHGVGMSQYGVIGLVRHSKGYKEILDLFYSNIEINDFKSAIKTTNYK